MISQSYGFRKAARGQKESQQHVLVEKISPLFDVYPHYKIHWGFDGMPMRPNMKISRWHVFKVVHVWNVRQGQGGFRCLCGHQGVYKMPLPEPVAYFPSVLQKGHSIRHSVGIQGFGHDGGGQCCQQYRKQALVIHFTTFGLFKKKGNKKGPVRKNIQIWTNK